MTYGFPVLLTANDKVWDRLQIIQNKALRATLGLPIYTSVEYVHRISKIPKIKEYATSLLHKSINTATSNKDQILLKHLQDIADQLRQNTSSKLYENLRRLTCRQ